MGPAMFEVDFKGYSEIDTVIDNRIVCLQRMCTASCRPVAEGHRPSLAFLLILTGRAPSSFLSGASIEMLGFCFWLVAHVYSLVQASR